MTIFISEERITLVLLKSSLEGSYNYISLSGDSSYLGLITKIVIDDSLIWFYGDKTISTYNTETRKQQLRLSSEPGFPFTGIINTPEEHS